MRKALAEGIGTFALVFTGCGAIVVNDVYNGSLGHLGISLVFGLVVMTMIYAVGNVSGAHFNPAVTLGFLLARRMDAREVPHYLAGQVVGGLAAAAAIRLLLPPHPTLGATLPTDGVLRSLVLEVLLTAILMFVILNVSTGYKEKGTMAGVAVGATVTLAALFGGPVSGASMNPIRSLAPATLSALWRNQWIYVVGPALGAALASQTCRLVQGADYCDGECDPDAV